MIKILVLGSNSFAGSCLVDYLLKKNFKVFGVSRSNENKIKYKENDKIKLNDRAIMNFFMRGASCIYLCSIRAAFGSL